MLATKVVQQLASRGETLAFCESLSAGLASATIAQVPGASAVFAGGGKKHSTNLKGGFVPVSHGVLDG